MIKTTNDEIYIGPLFAKQDLENYLIKFHNDDEWRAFAKWFRQKYEDLAADAMWPIIHEAVKRWREL